MSNTSMIESFLQEADAFERPNGWPGHHTARAPNPERLRRERSVKSRFQAGRMMPTQEHPWKQDGGGFGRRK